MSVTLSIVYPPVTWLQTSPRPIVKLCSSAAPTGHRYSLIASCTEFYWDSRPRSPAPAALEARLDSNKSYISLMRSGEAQLFPIAVARQP